MKEFRKSTSNIRLFVESYRDSCYPADRFRHPFLFTPRLLQDLKNLAFGGNDPLIQYKNRHTSVSIFSLAPLNEFGTEHGGAREKFLHYEETESRHMPSDRAAMETLSLVTQVTPSDRMTLYHWLDSFHIGIQIIFGPSCPLLTPCYDLMALFMNPVHFTGFSHSEFRAVLWSLHRGIRFFFMNKTTLQLQRLIADLEGGA